MATLRLCRRCPRCSGLHIFDGVLAEYRRWNDVCAAYLLCGRVYPGHDPKVHLLSLLRVHRRGDVRGHVVQADWWHLGTQLCSQQQVHHPDTCTSVTRRAAGCSCGIASGQRTMLGKHHPVLQHAVQGCCKLRGPNRPCSNSRLDILPGSMAQKAVYCHRSFDRVIDAS